MITFLLAMLAHAEPTLGTYGINRTFQIQSCESESKCDGKSVFEDQLKEEVLIEHSAKGDCGSVEHKLSMGGTPFKIEITACKKNDGKVTTYAMLRSGPTIKRNGVVKQHASNDNTLIDKPIRIQGQFFRAKVILESTGMVTPTRPLPYELEQTLLIEACDIKGSCESPPVFEEKMLDKITLTKMSKDHFCGTTLHYSFVFKKYNFETEANACRGDGKQTLYAMLHSAIDSNKYNVVIKTHDKDEWTLKGKLVKIDGQYYRARLILNPKVREVVSDKEEKLKLSPRRN